MRKNILVRGAWWTLGAVLILAGCALIWLLRNVLVLIFISLLLAAGLEPLIHLLRRGPFNRLSAIIVVYLLIFVALIIVLALVVPPFVSEVSDLIRNLQNPATLNSAANNLNIPGLPDLAQQASGSVGDLFKNVGDLTPAVTAGLTSLGLVLGIVTVFVITLSILTEREHIENFVLSFFPARHRPEVRATWQAVQRDWGGWVEAQLIIVVVTALVSWLGFSLIGLKYSLALGILMGLFQLVPLVGPVIGGVPALLVALTRDLTTALIVLVFVVVVLLAVNTFLIPQVLQKLVGVSPLVVMLSFIVGGTLAGITGAFLAIPVAALLQVLYNRTITRQAILPERP